MVINTDKITTTLGIAATLVGVVKQYNLVDSNLSTLAIAICTALFAYFTNKRSIAIK